MWPNVPTGATVNAGMRNWEDEGKGVSEYQGAGTDKSLLLNQLGSDRSDG
jgi:hypothetical protein